MKSNRAQLHTLVLRLWREQHASTRLVWQGTLLHTATGQEIHFVGEESLSENVSVILQKLGSDEKKGELR